MDPHRPSNLAAVLNKHLRPQARETSPSAHAAARFEGPTLPVNAYDPS